MGCGGAKGVKDNHDPAQKGGIRRIYKFEDIIGSGSFGKVMLAYNKLDHSKSKKVAIKAMKMKKVQNILKIIKRETAILQSLDHPNIVKYYETRYGSEYVYIVMEYCSGGELFQKILKEEVFCELEAGNIMQKLLRAIAHCHANGIAHRDIKPENIMYASDDPDSEVKLIDFGLSKAPAETKMSRGGGQQLPKKRQLSRKGTMVGTPYYVAPEVLTGYYSYACDIWSLGVLLYILLSGYLPFGGKETSQIFDKIKSAQIMFDEDKWGKVSPEAKDLVTNMLNRNENLRLTATQCLNHPWFECLTKRRQGGSQALLDPHILDRLKEYQGSSGFQKEVMNVLVKNLNDFEISSLKDQFHIIDQDQTGYITCEELREALNTVGNPLPPKQVDQLIMKIDYYGNHKINYSEFIAATLDAKSFLTKEKLWILFKHFDTDNSGVITEANIKEALSHSGKEISDKEVKKMIKEHDTLKNGTLSFKEFKTMMRQMTVHINDDHLEKLGVRPTQSEVLKP